MLYEVPPSFGADSYKAPHNRQYPKATEMVANGECRSGFKGMPDNRLVMYGMRYIIEKHLMRRWTQDDLDQASQFYSTHNAGGLPFPYPADLFQKIVTDRDGWFPVKIEALPDGTVFYPHVPVYQITAQQEFAPLCTFLETKLTHVWYPIAVATLSRHTRDLIQKYYYQTVDSEDFWTLDYRLHDFGYRGCTCEEQSIIGGSAHLLSFSGSDTMSAIGYVNTLTNKPFAQSIPATEHSVMTSWNSELEAVENMVHYFGHGVFACVADSYDYDKFLENVLPVVAPKIKKLGGVMVIRPDSGDPVAMVIKALYAAERHFGAKPNNKGYKVLQNAAVIQGDGIDYHVVVQILDAVKAAGFSVQNVAFGMGGGLLQKVNRDTISFATKLSQITLADGTVRMVMKAPITDPSKFSMPGKLQVNLVGDTPMVYPALAKWEDYNPGINLLKPVWDNGPVAGAFQGFDEVRSRLNHEWQVRPTKNPDVLSNQLKDLIATTRGHIHQRVNGINHVSMAT